MQLNFWLLNGLSYSIHFAPWRSLVVPFAFIFWIPIFFFFLIFFLKIYLEEWDEFCHVSTSHSATGSLRLFTGGNFCSTFHYNTKKIEKDESVIDRIKDVASIKAKHSILHFLCNSKVILLVLRLDMVVCYLLFH